MERFSDRCHDAAMLSVSVLLLLASTPTGRLLPKCDRSPKADVSAASWVDANRVWVVGRWSCGPCATSALIASVDFMRKEAKLVPVPWGAVRSDAQFGDGKPGELPEVLDKIVVSESWIAAAGSQQCQTSFEPFVLLSTDRGRTFVRHMLPVGNVHSAYVESLSLARNRVWVRLGVVRSSNGEEESLCFALTPKGHPERRKICPSAVLARSGTAVHVDETEGPVLVDTRGRRATISPPSR